MDIEGHRRVGLIVAIALVLAVGVVLAVSFTSTPTYISGEVPVAVEDGPEVVLVADGETEVNMQDIWGDEELDVETEHGDIVIGGDPGVEAWIHVEDIEGAQTVVTNISGGDDWLILDPGDKQQLELRGAVDTVRFGAVSLDDGSTDLEIEGTDGETVFLRLHDLPANEDVVLYDPQAGEILAADETDGSGVLDTDFELGGSSQDIEARTAGSFAPITLENPDPEGDVTELPDELSVDVSADAHPVNVTFDLDGETVGEETITANGTVTTDVDVSDLGEHQWNVTAVDAAGQTETLNTSFRTPDQLTVREEHDPETVVDDTTLTLRFYTVDGEIAIQRETDDGTLNMTGLPNSDFVVFVESDEHYDRRVYLADIFEQEDIFVLNATEFPREEDDAVASRFQYTDLTGQFPRAETTLQVQRAIDINGDGRSEWETVAGDFWGAGGEFEVVLEQGQRYQLVVEHRESGRSMNVGTHIPTADLAHEIRTSGLVMAADNATGVYANAELDEDDGVIDIVYRDPAEETDELEVAVIPQGGGDPIHNETVAGPLGTSSVSVSLNESQLEQNWIVEIESDRHRAAIPVGSGAIGLPVVVPGWLLTLLMSMAVTFVGALYGPRTALLGAWAMVFVAAGVAMFGWAFSGASIVVAALVAIGASFYARTAL